MYRAYHLRQAWRNIGRNPRDQDGGPQLHHNHHTEHAQSRGVQGLLWSRRWCTRGGKHGHHLLLTIK